MNTKKSQLSLTALVATSFLACGDNVFPQVPDAMTDSPADAADPVVSCDNYVLSDDLKNQYWGEVWTDMVNSGSRVCHSENCRNAETFDQYSNQLYIGDRTIGHLKMQDGLTSGFNAFATPHGTIVTYRDLLDSVKMGAIAYVSLKNNCATFDIWSSWATTINEVIYGGPGFESLTRPPGYDCVMNDSMLAGQAQVLAQSGFGGGVNNHEVTHIQKNHGDKRYCLWEQNMLTYPIIKAQEREADVGASEGIISLQCPPAAYGTVSCYFPPEGQLLVWAMITAWEGMVPEHDFQTHPPAHIRYAEAKERFLAHPEYHSGIAAFETVIMPTQMFHMNSGKTANRILETCKIPYEVRPNQ